jgi:hypothetical protein
MTDQAVQAATPRRRGRLLWPLAGILLALIVAAAVVYYLRGRPHTLTRGTVAGTSWELRSSRSSGHLCLELYSQGKRLSGGCGFSGAEMSIDSPGPGGSSFVYGPAPSSATTVRIDSFDPGGKPLTIPTHRLPGPFTSSRYYISRLPAGFTTGTLSYTDSAGRQVAPGRF